MMLLLCQRSELRLAVLLVGIIQVLWSALPFWGVEGFIAQVMRESYGWYWLTTMLFSGGCMIVSAVIRSRGLRHLSLFLSSVVWFSTFSLWVNEENFSTTPVTVTLPVLGLFCIGLLVNDASQKPRK